MEAREKTRKAIIPAHSKSLKVRSSSIVARGLRDLARDSRWSSLKLFSGGALAVAISPAGQACAVSSASDRSAGDLLVHEVELQLAPFHLPVGAARASAAARPAATFGFSPDGRRLIAASCWWPRELHVFDLHAKRFLGTFEPYSDFPSALAWSDAGNYFAKASRSAEAHIRVWRTAQAAAGGTPVVADTRKEVSLEGVTTELSLSEPLAVQIADEEAAAGFGRLAFSFDEKTLASVVEIEGEWADDSIQLWEMPRLNRRRLLQAQGHVTDLSWSFDGQLIYCSGGQAFRVAASATQAEPLPFGAELCACHPSLPLCICFSSWLKHSAREKLFAVNLKSGKVFDEWPARGVVDLRWKADGSKAYALTAAGTAHIYEPGVA
jgi:WD40 repeat protein